MGIIEDIKSAGKELVDKVKQGLESLGEVLDGAIQGGGEEPVPIPVKEEKNGRKGTQQNYKLVSLSELTLFENK